MDFIDGVRLFNTALAMTALSWLSIDLVGRVKDLSKRRLYLTLSLMGLLVSVVVGSVEQIIQNAAPGIRSAFTTAACVWALFGLYEGKDDDKDIVRD